MADDIQVSETNFSGKLIKKSSRGRTPDGEPNPIDKHVGKRIRLRRTLLGLSQEKLAALLGLTFQQVQKYERGMNRVGASRLWDIGKVLEVPIGFFFDDMDRKTAGQSPRMYSLPDSVPRLMIEDEPVNSGDPMVTYETINLVRAYYKIPNRKVAENLLELIVSLSRPINRDDKM